MTVTASCQSIGWAGRLAWSRDCRGASSVIARRWSRVLAAGRHARRTLCVCVCVCVCVCRMRGVS